jgi:branched-chain amino acid aminotransferase
MALPELKIRLTENSRLSTFDFNKIDFGKNFSDHMLIAEYADGAWQKQEIVPYGPLLLSPATTSFHYAQSVFEGMKAYLGNDGSIMLFRPLENFKRINRSGARISMPAIPEEIFMGGLEALLRLDKNWVPKAPGTSLYIRPFMMGSEPFIGVKTPDRYLFMIITSPVGLYYSGSVSVYVDEQNARAVKGVGEAKFAGNYAATLQPVEEARKKGYKDILWLDSEEHQWIQEVGTMNIFFVINGTILTPALDGGFLPGITRDSIIQLARHKGYALEERPIHITEVAAAAEAGTLTEVFGAGTAAVITLVDRLGYQGKDYHFNTDAYQIAPDLKASLLDIQNGHAPDPFGWVYKIPVQ